LYSGLIGDKKGEKQMRARFFVTLVVILALSASSLVEAGVRPLAQPLSAASGHHDRLISIGRGYAPRAPGSESRVGSSLPFQDATAIATGYGHTCALSAGGGVKCWGWNEYGQLGDGTRAPRSMPADVVGLASAMAAITAGESHTCALTTGGGVKCWGWNEYGQLGDGTTTSSSTPADVAGLASGVVDIAAGSSGSWHTCALTAGGGVKCWGANGFGQLGDGTTTGSSSPVDVTGLTSGASAIAVGSWHTCALTTGGGVKCWGWNQSGQLGDGTTTGSSTPVDVAGLTSGVVAIAAGRNHTCALTTGGGVKCWGRNLEGQLGDGTTTSSSTPVNAVGLASGVAAIAAGAYHACALTAGGGAKCWGNNLYGQLGDGTTADRSTPLDVVGLESGVAAISAGYGHTCVLTAGGGIKCWGWNHAGQLGCGTITRRVTPVDVVGLASAVGAIATGSEHTCALTTGGGAQCWGPNRYGQLGDGTTTQRSAPVDVVGLASGVAAISAGQWHTCALTAGGGVGTPSRQQSGGVKCWGYNGSGGLGDGTAINRSTPVDVVGLVSGVAAIAAGGRHTCALTTGGGVKCWGAGSTTVVDVVGLESGVAAVAAGWSHTCAVTTGGAVKCWGDNEHGELGDGTTAPSGTPVDVVGLGSGVAAIAGGLHHTCALTASGGVKCWGWNDYGQLGDGTTVSSTTPVGVAGLTSGVASLSAGWWHTCALTTGGGVKCWGRNWYGQLGDGTTVNSGVPADVVGLAGGAAAISAGEYHTCALTAGGGVRCWGSDSSGQLGLGTITYRTTPVDVVLPLRVYLPLALK
jgi:alpha-tubulin suppressor-like RCC1 family protein